MANIITAQDLLNKARAARANGLFTDSARFAIASQRIAKQCRSAARGDVAWSAHNVIAACKMQATSQADRSNAGNILAESQLIGWDF